MCLHPAMPIACLDDDLWVCWQRQCILHDLRIEYEQISELTQVREDGTRRLKDKGARRGAWQHTPSMETTVDVVSAQEHCALTTSNALSFTYSKSKQKSELPHMYASAASLHMPGGLPLRASNEGTPLL